VLNPDGTERSCWPAKWSLEYLKQHEHTQDYKKEFLNQPVSPSGDYWTDEDFVYEASDTVFDMLVFDPAVSARTSSHDTGLAVVGFNDARGVVVVKYATTVRLPPKELRNTALWYLEQFPEIGLLRIEVNQGGDTWASVFHDMPVRLEQSWSSLNKDFRYTRLLNAYQRGQVVHYKPLPRLEAEMCAHQTGMDSDLIDAVEIGVRRFIKPKRMVSGGTYSYLHRTPLSEVGADE
jgi:phage terminase large subunit-like protein